jgi:hypothetical protein
MSIIPEYIIQQALVEGLEVFRKDRRIVDVLFRQLSQSEAQGIWNFLQNNSIDISVNYPDDDVKLPSISILLQEESESESFLGNVMEHAISVSKPFHIPTIGSSSISAVTGNGPRILQSDIEVTGFGSTSVTAAASVLPLADPFEESPIWVFISEGVGIGQKREIVSITPMSATDTVVEITPSWDVLPDIGSKFKILGKSLEVAGGEPSRLFEAGEVIERVGAHYEAQYQLLITAPSQDALMYLYIVVKAILFSFNEFFIKQGFLNLRLSGSDFTDRGEDYPDRGYQRSLLMAFSYSFDVYRSIQVINRLLISTNLHTDPAVPSSPEAVGIQTEIDISGGI